MKQKEKDMSSLSLSISTVERRGYASTSDVVCCFEEQRPLLMNLAFLITGDEFAAAQCVENARESTLKSHSPFRDCLLEWAKTATIQLALLRSARVIRSFEDAHKGWRCDHPEHLGETVDERRHLDFQRLTLSEATGLISELDPLCRAVLVLRLALRYSIQECAFRLNVSRLAIIGASCRAMEWLGNS